MLVWKAIPSMTPMMSAILRLEAVMSSIFRTTSRTTSPPLLATCAAVAARRFASAADSALPFTVEVSCSIELAARCSWLAACSVRWLRSALPFAISLEADSMLAALPWVAASAVRSRPSVSASAAAEAAPWACARLIQMAM